MNNKIKKYEVISCKSPVHAPTQWQYRMGIKHNNTVTTGMVSKEDNHPDTVLDGLTQVELVWTNHSPEQPTEEQDVIRVVKIRGVKYEVINA